MTDAGARNLSTVSDRNLYTLLDRAFERAAGQAAFVAPNGEPVLLCGELRERAARYANALEVLGVTPGDRVTVQTEKSIAAIALYLATLKCGAVYQPLNTAYTLAEVEYFLTDAEPRVIVCDPSRQVAMRGFADRLKL